jgi:hypothetical protein
MPLTLDLTALTSVTLKTERSSPFPKQGDPILASKKAPTSTRAAKPSIDQEQIDDQRFQVKIENKHFIDGIVREANKYTACPNCGDSDWRMQPKFWASIVMNALLAVMVCRNCKRKVFFETQIEKDYPDEDEEESEEQYGDAGDRQHVYRGMMLNREFGPAGLI